MLGATIGCKKRAEGSKRIDLYGMLHLQSGLLQLVEVHEGHYEESLVEAANLVMTSPL